MFDSNLLIKFVHIRLRHNTSAESAQVRTSLAVLDHHNIRTIIVFFSFFSLCAYIRRA